VSMAMVDMDVIGSLSYKVTTRLHLLLIRVHNAIQDLAATNANTFLSF
jgi:hypothetical protein